MSYGVAMSLTAPKIAAALVLLIVLGLCGGFLALGLNAVPPVQASIHKDLPPDHFATVPSSAGATATLPVMPPPAASPNATPVMPAPATTPAVAH